jgi:hypothetical protein
LAGKLEPAASVCDCEFTIKLRRKEGEAVNGEDMGQAGLTALDLRAALR